MIKPARSADSMFCSCLAQSLILNQLFGLYQISMLQVPERQLISWQKASVECKILLAFPWQLFFETGLGCL
jgi:hypothetical protein